MDTTGDISHKTLSVCYFSSNEYASYTGVSMLSLLDNNSDLIDCVYLISYGINSDQLIKIKSITDHYGCNLIVIDALRKIKDSFISLGLPLFEGSHATYSRALISEIIDEYNGLLLCIDSDTIVNGRIDEMIEIDFDRMNKVYAAVVGVNQYIWPYQERILYEKGKVYFQCGVLLIHLGAWRRRACAERIIDYIKSADIKDFLYADQTIINNALPSEMGLILPLKYNYWGHMFRGRRIMYELTRGGYYSREDVEEAAKCPIIIHYKGHVVHPWLEGNVSSESDRFDYYLGLSPWKGLRKNTIYYDENDGCESPSQRLRSNRSVQYLKNSALHRSLIEKLSLVKWKLKGLMSQVK